MFFETRERALGVALAMVNNARAVSFGTARTAPNTVRPLLPLVLVFRSRRLVQFAKKLSVSADTRVEQKDQNEGRQKVQKTGAATATPSVNV